MCGWSSISIRRFEPQRSSLERADDGGVDHVGRGLIDNTLHAADEHQMLAPRIPDRFLGPGSEQGIPALGEGNEKVGPFQFVGQVADIVALHLGREDSAAQSHGWENRPWRGEAYEAVSGGQEAVSGNRLLPRKASIA